MAIRATKKRSISVTVDMRVLAALQSFQTGRSPRMSFLVNRFLTEFLMGLPDEDIKFIFRNHPQPEDAEILARISQAKRSTLG